jgi:hypothetical protein
MATVKMRFAVWLESEMAPGFKVMVPLFHRFISYERDAAVLLTSEGVPHAARCQVV